MKAPLPRSYYFIVAVWLACAFFFGVAVSVSIGINPYIGGSVLYGAALLREVYSLRKSGF